MPSTCYVGIAQSPPLELPSWLAGAGGTRRGESSIAFTMDSPCVELIVATEFQALSVWRLLRQGSLGAERCSTVFFTFEALL